MEKTATTVTNAQVHATSITQSANEMLGVKEKKLYFLIIITDKGQVRLNVGEKTHNSVNELIKPKK